MDVFLVSCAAMLMCVDEPSSASVSVCKLFYVHLYEGGGGKKKKKKVIAID